MISVIALLTVAVIAVGITGAAFSLLRSRERSWERRERAWDTERADLLNRVMYLAQKPWQGPPEIEEPPPPLEEDFFYDPLMLQEHEIV